MKQGEIILATGHDTELVGAKAATCTEDGYTGDEVCKTCGQTVKQGKIIPATGHHYVDGKCTDCGAKKPEASNAQTGDDSLLVLWTTLLVASAAAAVMLTRKKRMF